MNLCVFFIFFCDALFLCACWYCKYYVCFTLLWACMCMNVGRIYIYIYNDIIIYIYIHQEIYTHIIYTPISFA